MLAAFRTQSKFARHFLGFLPFRKPLASIRVKYLVHQSRSGRSRHLASREIFRLPLTPCAFE